MGEPPSAARDRGAGTKDEGATAGEAIKSASLGRRGNNAERSRAKATDAPPCAGLRKKPKREQPNQKTRSDQEGQAIRSRTASLTKKVNRHNREAVGSERVKRAELNERLGTPKSKSPREPASRRDLRPMGLERRINRRAQTKTTGVIACMGKN